MSDFLVSIYLGFIQGLTEFLPVSSSGHLALSRILLEYLGVDTTSLGNDLFLEVLLHVGTLLVVLVYYRKEIGQFFSEWTGIGTPASTTIPAGACRNWTFYILLSTLVTGSLAVPLKDAIENAFHSLSAVGTGLLFTSFVLFLSWKRSGRTREEDSQTRMNMWFAILIGVGQFVAIFPGVSRSGTTIAVALLLGMKRDQAVTYSFLISIPAILGGVAFTARGIDEIHLLGPLAGMTVSALFGWLALGLLVRLVIQGKLVGFSIYCLVVGSIALFLSF